MFSFVHLAFLGYRVYFVYLLFFLFLCFWIWDLYSDTRFVKCDIRAERNGRERLYI